MSAEYAVMQHVGVEQISGTPGDWARKKRQIPYVFTIGIRQPTEEMSSAQIKKDSEEADAIIIGLTQHLV